MRSFFFLFKEFLGSLRQNRYLHFTYGAQVTTSLLVLGIFFVLLVGASMVWSKIGSSMEIHVFLENELSALQIDNVEDKISEIPSVPEGGVEYRSKEDALASFSARNPTLKLSELLDENPLPNSFIVRTGRPTEIPAVVSQIEQIPGVLTIRYASQMLEKYQQVMLVLMLICLVTMSLLVLFTYSSINNIISMSIYARRSEIRIMQLVGATWWFIRWPFIFEGLFFGVIGAITAVLMIWGLMATVGEALRVTQLSMAIPMLGIGPQELMLGLGALLVVIGLTVGFFGSLRTVNQFLRRDNQLAAESLRIRQAVGGAA